MLVGGSKFRILVEKLKNSTGRLLERCVRAIFAQGNCMKEVERDLEELKQLHQFGLAQSILHFHWHYALNDSLDAKNTSLKLKLPDLET